MPPPSRAGGGWVFQSTPSAGRATQTVIADNVRKIDFNPRPPRGGRPVVLNGASYRSCISIHALRGEGDPNHLTISALRLAISIHALRGEGDGVCHLSRALCSISIHALRGEGDVPADPTVGVGRISIHALRGEGDMRPLSRRKRVFNFNPRPPRGGRHRGY